MIAHVCGGMVCGADSEFRRATKSAAALDAAAMCPPVRYMGGALDMPSGEFKISSSACHNGSCENCGLKPIVGERNCKHLYNDRPCNIHHFEKITRGLNKHGKPIEATEFVPLVTTRRGACLACTDFACQTFRLRTRCVRVTHSTTPHSAAIVILLVLHVCEGNGGVLWGRRYVAERSPSQVRVAYPTAECTPSCYVPWGWGGNESERFCK